MKFSSAIERKQHPQACLIPLSLWESPKFFNNTLSDAQLLVMQASKAELGTILEVTMPSTDQEKICLALAMAFVHPDLNVQELLQLTQILALDKELLLEYACLLGKVDFFQACLHSYSDMKLEIIIANHRYELFHWAAENGHLALMSYIRELIPHKTQAMIAADTYHAFRSASQNGHLAILECLIHWAPQAKENMINAGHYEAFGFAAENGHLTILEYLINLAPHKAEIMIDSALRRVACVAQKGNLEALEFLIHRASKSKEITIQEMLVHYEVFGFAAANNHLAVMERLMKLAPEQVQAMIAADDYAAFRLSNLEVMERLMELAPDKIQEMIVACEYSAFRISAAKGHLARMERLMELAPGRVQAMIAADNYAAFISAAQNGHLVVMERLMELAPDEIKAMIAANNYAAFISAARNGHLVVMERLMELAPDEIKAMIAAPNDRAFETAAGRGHLEVLKRLMSLVPEETQQNMIVASCRAAINGGHSAVMKWFIQCRPQLIHDEKAFCSAAASGRLAMIALFSFDSAKIQDLIAEDAFFQSAYDGHLIMMEHLMALLAPEKIHEVILDKSDRIWYSAAENGSLEVMERFMQLAPEKIQHWISDERGDRVFYAASRFEHLDVIERLLEVLEPEEVEATMRGCFDEAVKARQVIVIDHLLSFPEVFSYAEQLEDDEEEEEDDEDSQRSYPEYYVNSFTSHKLQKLRLQKAEMELANPHAVFDLENLQEISLLFYCLRNFIRRQESALLDDMRFLLEIPAVKNRAHTGSTPDLVNELLRLAIRIGNQEAAALLLTLPEVDQLARQHNYYPEDAQGHMDLRVLARDRESSLHALSSVEHKRLEAVIARYQPQLTQLSVPKVMQGLTSVLARRYLQNPAKIMQNKDGLLVPLALPGDWKGFQDLDLAPEEKEEALKAYYQHKDHTVLRYLSRPNRWMHEHAEYVYSRQIADQPKEQWSSYENYLSLISLLFLAVWDKNAPPIEGHSFETRLEHFITELALIGRAHNWDRSRTKVDAENNIILDVNGKSINEEFDDLEGDRPSCYSGVKRRLFQSVMGHPLFILLSKEKLRQEMQEFVRLHFQLLIKDTNRDLIKKAYDETIFGNEEEEKEEDQASREQKNFSLLQSLDISPAQQQTFLQYLTQKYGVLFSQDEELLQFTHNTFALKSDEVHLLKLDYFGLSHLLQRPNAELLAQIGLHPRPVEEKEADQSRASKRHCPGLG